MMDEYDNPTSMKKSDLIRRVQRISCELQDQGYTLSPITTKKQNLAQSPWGKAWVKSLSQFNYEGVHLAPGRSLLRAGCVLDMNVKAGRIESKLVAHELLNVQLSVKTVNDEQLESLQKFCMSYPDSWMSLVEGKVSDDIMHHLCDREEGMFPAPSQWKTSCACDDWSDVCPHAAAVLYAFGVYLDEHPEALFTLLDIDPRQLIPQDSAWDVTSNISDEEDEPDWAKIFQCRLG